MTLRLGVLTLALLVGTASARAAPPRAPAPSVQRVGAAPAAAGLAARTVVVRP
jgi:hypothetical protein